MSGWVAGAVVVGGIAGSVISSNAASSAADTQANAANQATAANTAASDRALAENQRQYDLNRADQQPIIQRGNAAGNQLQQLMGLGGDTNAAGYGSLNNRFTGANVTSEPGYQFGLQQGQRGLDAGAAARGGYYSGAQLKAASRYNTDYASTKYNDAYNRFNNDQSTQFNRLSGIAGTGQTAINQIGAQGASMAANNGSILTNTAFNNGNNLMGAGNARASGYVGSANALTSALGTGINQYQSNQLLNRMNNNSGYSSGGYVDEMARLNAQA